MAKNDNSANEVSIIYPQGSGIRIRRIVNESGGKVYGGSYLVDVPAALTGGRRIREQKKTLVEAKRLAAQKYRGAKQQGESFFQLSEQERCEIVDWLPKLREAGITLPQASEFALTHLIGVNHTVTLSQFADEFLGALSGQQITKRVEEDETVSLVTEDIETTAEDFILKTLAQELKGHPFEEFVAHLLGTMGYWTRGVPKGADGGVDIVATKDELGVEPPIIKVQVKSTEGSVSNPEVTALYGNVDQNEFGLLFTLGSFTSQAKVFARNKTNLRLIDGPDLVKMVLNHYEDFNSKYKGLLPLKRVYVPEPQPDGD